MRRSAGVRQLRENFSAIRRSWIGRALGVAAGIGESDTG
jgi:hypothetical protein